MWFISKSALHLGLHKLSQNLNIVKLAVAGSAGLSIGWNMSRYDYKAKKRYSRLNHCEFTISTIAIKL